MSNKNNIPKVLQNEIQYKDLYFYQKSEVLYALTYHFAKHYLHAKSDRTVDQKEQLIAEKRHLEVLLQQARHNG